jgi:hypothetical protein
MVSLVERMLALHKLSPRQARPTRRLALQRQIEATDGQIEALVYELYGLTEEEIGIVVKWRAARSKTLAVSLRVLRDFA